MGEQSKIAWCDIQWPIEADPAVEKPVNDPKGGDWNEWPEDLRVREFYK